MKTVSDLLRTGAWKALHANFISCWRRVLVRHFAGLFYDSPLIPLKTLLRQDVTHNPTSSQAAAVWRPLPVNWPVLSQGIFFFSSFLFVCM